MKVKPIKVLVEASRLPVNWMADYSVKFVPVTRYRYSHQDLKISSSLHPTAKKLKAMEEKSIHRSFILLSSGFDASLFILCSLSQHNSSCIVFCENCRFTPCGE
jgi:hypothetical protein